jgi:hypothetical protein
MNELEPGYGQRLEREPLQSDAIAEFYMARVESRAPERAISSRYMHHWNGSSIVHASVLAFVSR